MTSMKPNVDVTNIEQLICKFFDLQYQRVFSKDTHKELVLARHFTIFILHTHYKMSANYLAKRYHCNIRNIHYACANMRFFVDFDKKYRTYYSCLLQYIEKGER